MHIKTPSSRSLLAAAVVALFGGVVSTSFANFWDPAAVTPGITFGAPSGFGANWGDAYVGFGVASRSVSKTKTDMSGVLGMGFGNADNLFAAELAVGVIGMTDGGVLSDGNYALKLHKNFGATGVAVGLVNAARWGKAREKSTGAYFALTRVIPFPRIGGGKMPIFATVGLGSGPYRKLSDVNAGKKGAYAPFFALGVQLHPRIGFIADYTGEKFNVAASVVPMAKLPITVTLGVADLGKREYPERPFVAVASYTIKF